MARRDIPDGVRTFAAYAAAGGAALLALAFLNIAADKFDLPGLRGLRNYLTGNGGN